MKPRFLEKSNARQERGNKIERFIAQKFKKWEFIDGIYDFNYKNYAIELKSCRFVIHHKRESIKHKKGRDGKNRFDMCQGRFTINKENHEEFISTAKYINKIPIYVFAVEIRDHISLCWMNAKKIDLTEHESKTKQLPWFDVFKLGNNMSSL